MNKTVTVLGNGFAALTAVRELRRSSPDITIQLIAPTDEFIYYPSLIWIPSGLRTGDDLRINLQSFFTKYRVDYIQDRVINIKDDGRTVVTTGGHYINDGLIIGTGGRFIKKLPGIEHVITPCAGIEAAEQIRDRLDNMESGTIAMGFGGNPKEPSAMRGGPIFEFILGTDSMLRQQGRRDKFQLVFFSPAPEPGKRLGKGVPDYLMRKMAERDIKVNIGKKMVGFEERQVKMEGLEFAADLILFNPGMTGPDWLAESDFPMSDGGLIRADEHTRVAGLTNTYVAGDAGSFPGPAWQAKQAHAADLQAVCAAKNLLKSLGGHTDLDGFKHELICIIDSNDKGIMVKRTEKSGYVLPQWRLMHWAKRFFEWYYLRQFR